MIPDQTASPPAPAGNTPAGKIPTASVSANQTTVPPPLLQLAAMDADDLAILSAHLQDMRVAVGDLAYLPTQRRFALVGKRFDWVKAAVGGCERCATGLHFDWVHAVARHGFAQGDGERQLNLLAIEFAGQDAAEGASDASPTGTVTLTFSGGAALRLTVECLEAQMRDLGERWPCERAPVHP